MFAIILWSKYDCQLRVIVKIMDFQKGKAPYLMSHSFCEESG